MTSDQEREAFASFLRNRDIYLSTHDQLELCWQAALEWAESHVEKTSRAKHYGNGYQDGWNSALEEAAKRAESMHHDSAPYWAALRIRELKKEQS